METYQDKITKKEKTCAIVLVVYLCFLLVWPFLELGGVDGLFIWSMEHLSLSIILLLALAFGIGGEGVISLVLLIAYFVVVLLMIFGVLFSFKKPRAIWIVYVICIVDIILALLMLSAMATCLSMILFDAGIITLAKMMDRRQKYPNMQPSDLRDL